MSEKLESVNYQIERNIIRKTREETLRELWNDTCYPIHQGVILPVEVAKAVNADITLQERMVNEISEFTDKLTISDYLEAIHFDIVPNIRDTAFQVTLSVSEPSDGFKKSTRQWFNYTLPPMDKEANREIVNILIKAFLNRPVIERKGRGSVWCQGAQLDVRTHRVTTSSDLRRDMEDLLKEGGRVSLQRVPLTLRAKRKDGPFFAKYGELQNFSLQG